MRLVIDSDKSPNNMTVSFIGFNARELAAGLNGLFDGLARRTDKDSKVLKQEFIFLLIQTMLADIDE